MNNNRGMLTSLFTIGVAGAAIYGITKGVQNGTFQRLPQNVSNILNNQQTQQSSEPSQNMESTQNPEGLTTPLNPIN